MSQKAWRWVCVMLSAPGLGLADFQAGLDAYNQGNYAVAMREWDALAEAGDVAAQHNLARIIHERDWRGRGDGGRCKAGAASDAQAYLDGTSGIRGKPNAADTARSASAAKRS